MISGAVPHIGHLISVSPKERISVLAFFANIYGRGDFSCNVSLILSITIISSQFPEFEIHTDIGLGIAPCAVSFCLLDSEGIPMIFQLHIITAITLEF